MKASLDPQDYVGRSQDGVWDPALEATLRAEPEEVRAEFLSQVLVLQERAGKGRRYWFNIAKSLLTNIASYERLLRDGLTVADASSVKDWLECSMQRIGMRRVVQILRNEDASRPEAVNLTAYWLPELARSPKEEAVVKSFLTERRAAKKM